MYVQARQKKTTARGFQPPLIVLLLWSIHGKVSTLAPAVHGYLCCILHQSQVAHTYM